jgi:hypothetical protein
MFVLIGYSIPGFVFGAAAAGYIICCAIVVPLLVLLSGHLKFWAWQFAIASLTLAVFQVGKGKSVSLKAVFVLNRWRARRLWKRH